MDQQDEQEKQNAADEALDQEVRIVDVFCCCLRFHPFALTFTFYFLILRWAAPNSAYLFRLLVLKTWGSSYQKCHFGNRFILFLISPITYCHLECLLGKQNRQTNLCLLS